MKKHNKYTYIRCTARLQYCYSLSQKSCIITGIIDDGVDENRLDSWIRSHQIWTISPKLSKIVCSNSCNTLSLFNDYGTNYMFVSYFYLQSFIARLKEKYLLIGVVKVRDFMVQKTQAYISLLGALCWHTRAMKINGYKFA